MYINEKILVGKNEESELSILLNKANRHGLITGASGSGKTITLKVMAESFSAAGVPVFLADIKGDLAATCMPGETNEKIQERLTGLKIEDFQFKGYPVVFWDVFAKDGHPIRTTVQSVGPIILSRMLGLNQTQEGVLAIVFKIAKDKGYELINLKDLRILLQYVAEHSAEYTIEYGNVTNQSVGTIQRNLLMLEEQGGEYFFGEPDIQIDDLFKNNTEGLGNVNILHAVELIKQPKLYSCFLLWLLTTMNNTLPEVGDLDKPKMVFFFDEAHLLFDELPDYIQTQVVQVVKLIRSKGVGVYFISQSPSDVPDEILAQLGNRVQHTLRAYTPAEQKVVKAVASSYRANPAFDTEQAILNLGTGEAIISFVNEKGEPGIVEKATILPPQSQMGTLDDAVRLMVMSRSEFKGKYDTLVDRESAYEILGEELKKKQEESIQIQEMKEQEKIAKEEEKLLKAQEKLQKQQEKEAEKARKKTVSYKVEKAVEKTANSMLSTMGRKIGTSIINSFFKKK